MRSQSSGFVTDASVERRVAPFELLQCTADCGCQNTQIRRTTGFMAQHRWNMDLHGHGKRLILRNVSQSQRRVISDAFKTIESDRPSTGFHDSEGSDMITVSTLTE